MHLYWRIYVMVWLLVIEAAVGGAYLLTKPKYDTLTRGTVTKSKEVSRMYQGTATFAYELTIAFPVGRQVHTVTYPTRIPGHISDLLWISYDSRDPDRYEFYDASAFRDTVQLIAVALLMMAFFSAGIVRLRVAADRAQ